MPPEANRELEKKAGVKFKDAELLREALTHKSHAMERNETVFNERLEFLGDSVLSIAVSEYLFKRFPSYDEGRLSKIKSQLVSRTSLVEWARDMDLGKYLFISLSEESTGGRNRDSILANAFEALIGAILLDAGFESARRFIVKHLDKKKKLVENDYKSQLQETVQKRFKIPPEYEIVSETGPDHDKTFKISVRVKTHVLGHGTGKSKKEAEQAAAKEALRKLKAKPEKLKAIAH